MNDNPENQMYGPVLGRIRRAKQIKAATLARCLGISTSTYSRIESGQRSASFERVARICRELDLDWTQLAVEIDSKEGWKRHEKTTSRKTRRQ